MRCGPPLCVVVLALGGCSSSGDESPAPTSSDSPRQPDPSISREKPEPLNLYEIGFAMAPDHRTVGTIDGEPVLVDALDQQSVGAFSRIGKELLDARFKGRGWLLQHTALRAMAADKHMTVLQYMNAIYASIPAPTSEDLAAIDPSGRLAHLPRPERKLAGTTMWRLRKWRALHDEAAYAGAGLVDSKRPEHDRRARSYADPGIVLQQLDGRSYTRDDFRVLGGFRAEVARRDYYRLAKRKFDEHVTQYLVEREASRLDTTPDALYATELAATPKPSKADLAAFLKEQPQYKDSETGLARARDVLRRRREVRARESLHARLVAAAKVTFHLDEPSIMRVPAFDLLSPRTRGDASASHELVVFHSVACKECQRGSALILELTRRLGDKVRLVSADYFGQNRIASYRGALAIRCAGEDGKWWEMFELLTADPGTGEVSQLAERAERLGLDAAAFRACVESDRYLPIIMEDVELAERLGLERNIPGIFLDGVRIGELGDIDAVMRQVDEIMRRD